MNALSKLNQRVKLSLSALQTSQPEKEPFKTFQLLKGMVYSPFAIRS